MAAFEIDAALRWFRFNRTQPLKRRPDSDLPFVHGDMGAGQGLLLDTCVYIDGLKGRLDDGVERLLVARNVNHSTVCIQELMFGIGALDRNDRRTPAAIGEVRNLIRAMQPHRLFAPDADLSARAALLAGLLSRLQDYTGDARKRALMDATIFLQAQKLGLIVVTANIGDFDIMLQLVTNARVLFYRGAPHATRRR